jgi:alpha-D-xyloside xylohydrolase
MAREHVTASPHALRNIDAPGPRSYAPAVRSRIAVAALLLLVACPPPPKPTPPPLSLSSAGATVTFADDGTFTLSRNGAALLRFDASAFQVGTVRELDATKSYDPYWLVTDDPVLQKVEPPGFKWRGLIKATVAKVSDTEVGIDATFDPDVTGRVTVTAAAHGFTVRFVPATDVRPVAMLRVRPRADPKEGFYGLGEWFDDVNHRGKVRPMQLEADLNVESAYTENHVVTPFVVGTRGWGLFVETNRFGVMSFARGGEDDLVDTMWGTAEQSADGLTVHLFSADHPLDVLKPYLSVSGALRLPSTWAWGPLIWRDESRDQAEVVDDIAKVRQLDLATSAMWIDRPYATAVNTFDFDPALYPDAGAMIQTAHAAGLRVALWHTPYLEPDARALRAEADQGGFFPPMTGLQLNRWSAPLDFTNPAADAFWRRNLRRYRDLGIEGFKLDFAEDVIAGLSGAGGGWRFSDGSTERTMATQYTRLYHRAYRATLGDLDGFLIARAGKWGSQSMGLVIWPGDIDASLTRFGEVAMDRSGKKYTAVGGVASAVRAGQSLSMSGFPFFGADTGGYRHSPPDKETFMRWVSQSALSTVMQTGDSSSQPPWVFTAENGRDDAALAHYRAFARLHLRLFPFGWSWAKQMLETGRPIQRPFGVAFPELGVHPADQYLLGDELLVAPVEVAGQTQRTLVHPPGRWEGWFDGATLPGEPGAQVTVSAPLDAIPLFVREGALVPMLRPTIDTLAPATDPGVESFESDAGDLWVRVVPSTTPTVFTVFDGTTLRQEKTDVLSLRATGGTRFTKNVVFELFVPQPTSVERDGQALRIVADLSAVTAGMTWSAGRLIVKGPIGATFTVR